MLVSAAVLSLGACAGPTLTVETDPGDARIHVDGRAESSGYLYRNLPYYGTVGLTAIPEPPGVGPELPVLRGIARRELRVDPPITRWIFPFDLVYELVTAPWREWDTRVKLEAPVLPRIVSQVQPTRTLEILERARAMRTAR